MRYWSISLLLFVTPVARADVKPHGLFTDNAVLQRAGEIPVWGTASPGEEVTVTFRQAKATTKADADGRWMVKLPAQRFGGPDDLVIRGNNTVTLKNVMVGEVWICSGQSNMEWPLNRSADHDKHIAAAKHPRLRLFKVKNTASGEPLREVPVGHGWVECTPEVAANFSAVGYYFGRDLLLATNVPVGLIQTAWGGTPAQAWTSREALDSVPALRHYNETFAAVVKRWESGQARSDYEKARQKYLDEAAKAKENGQPAPKAPREPMDPRRQPTSTTLYNGMIAPLVPYAIKGATWYQGESNGSQGYEYRTLFTTMIQDWRTRWGGSDFPFLCVQLAPFNAFNDPAGPQWAELREAQLWATQKLPRVGMAVITDVGEAKDIHPQRKEPVGARLALLARKIAYGENIVAQGPLYKTMKTEGNRIVLSFDSAGSGLEAKGGKLTGFTICGDDKKFVPAEAEIRGDTVVVWADGVEKPVAVRFGWSNCPEVNLFNKNSLPASPFRTDDFPLTSDRRGG